LAPARELVRFTFKVEMISTSTLEPK
jgi:hypothetical protein